MKRLLLHLGMAKTGTTSLQETLGQHQQALREVGVIYPRHRPFNHSYTFQVLFKDDPSDSFYYKQTAPVDDESWEAELEVLRQRWLRSFSSFEAGTFVISAENLPGMTEEEIQRLLDFVSPHFDAVSAIVYIRDPRDALRSRWEQDVKESLGELSGNALLQRAKQRLNYKFLERWSNILGRDQMTVRPFDSARLHQGNLLSDFFLHGGLGDFPELELNEQTANQSLGPEGTAFLLAFNERYPQIRAGKLNPERGLSRRMHLLYESMRAIREKRLDFEVRFTAEEAEVMNARLGMANTYLKELDQFALVPASSAPTELPDPDTLDTHYYLDLINQLALEIDRLADAGNPPAREPLVSDKPFDRVYLHIGLGKTGTTAIQRRLCRAALELEQQGVHFPASLEGLPNFEGNHSQLLRAIFRDNPRKSCTKFSAEQVRAALRADFEGASAPTLLLSAEGVAYMHRPDLHALFGWLAELADEIKVIACVRHPVAALSSQIQQVLKTGAVLDSLYRDPPYYKFHRLFPFLLDKLGRHNLMVYDFADAVAHADGIEGAFLEKLGLSVGGQDPMGAASNTSMSTRAAFILSEINSLVPVVVDGKPNPDRPKGIIPELMTVPGPRYEAPPAIRRLVQDRTQAELTWLKENLELELQPAEPASQGGIVLSFLGRLRVKVAARLLLWKLRFKGSG